MNTKTDSALRDLIESLLDDDSIITTPEVIADRMVIKAEQIARALIAHCPDLVIVPRGDVSYFEVLDHEGIHVAGCSGSHDEALAEAMHYATMYADDGPVTVVECFELPIAKLTVPTIYARQKCYAFKDSQP